MATKNTPQTTGGKALPGGKDFKVDLVVNDNAEVYVFHSKSFENRLSWLEFDLNTRTLDFVMNDGDVRSFGARVPERLTKHMHNAFQVMMVQMDEETGQAVSGDYFPLILHKAYDNDDQRGV